MCRDIAIGMAQKRFAGFQGHAGTPQASPESVLLMPRSE
jgi:hypothetical protein